MVLDLEDCCLAYAISRRRFETNVFDCVDVLTLEIGRLEHREAGMHSFDQIRTW